MNVVQISGRLTRDPELRYVGQSNFPIMELNVAVDDADGRYDSQQRASVVGSGFYKIEAKGEYAEALFLRLHKGDEVYVTGSLTQFRLKPKEGQEHGETKTSIAAKMIVPLTGGAVENPLPPLPRDEEPF